MHNFFFHNPCKVIFGNGRLKNLVPEAVKLGRRALLIHGQAHLENSGRLEKTISALSRAGIQTDLFGGMGPNPTFTDAARGIDHARGKNCDLIIGIGGGSVMDSARAISAGVFSGRDLRPMFHGKGGAKKRLPLILVPTIAGTGAATGHGMVLRDEEQELKLGCGNVSLFADTAIIDPELMLSAPRIATARAAVDGFCHAMEFFCNHSAADARLQKRLLAAMAATIFNAAGAEHPGPEASGEIAWAGELIMNGMITAGIGWTSLPLHAIEHSLGGCMNSAHGSGVAFLTRGWFRLQRQDPAPTLAEFCRRVFQIRADNDHETIITGEEYFSQWLKKINCPVPAATRENRDRDDKIISGAITQAGIWRIRDLDREKIAAILKAARKRPGPHS